jgi:hypothetical protein
LVAPPPARRPRPCPSGTPPAPVRPPQEDPPLSHHCYPKPRFLKLPDGAPSSVRPTTWHYVALRGTTWHYVALLPATGRPAACHLERNVAPVCRDFQPSPASGCRCRCRCRRCAGMRNVTGSTEWCMVRRTGEHSTVQCSAVQYSTWHARRYQRCSFREGCRSLPSGWC